MSRRTYHRGWRNVKCLGGLAGSAGSSFAPICARARRCGARRRSGRPRQRSSHPRCRLAQVARDDRRRTRQAAAARLDLRARRGRPRARRGDQRLQSGQSISTARLGVVAVDEHEVDLARPAAATSCESATCQRTAGARAPRRRPARDSRRRVARSLAPHPPGSASGWRPKGSIRCSCAPARALLQHQRRGALVDADLDDALRAARGIRAARGRPRLSASCAAGSAPVRRERAQAHVVAQARGARQRTGWGRIAIAPAYAQSAVCDGGAGPARAARA